MHDAIRSDLLNTIFPRGAFLVNKVLENHEGQELLDIGCGKGSIDIFLGRKYGIKITGIDLDETEIAAATRQNNSSNIHFICNNINNLITPYKGVLLIEVLEHIRTPDSFMSNVNRLCKPNGFLILTIPNGYSIKEIIYAVIHLFSVLPIFSRIISNIKKSIIQNKTFNKSPHIQRYTRSKIRGIINRSGFDIIEEFYGDIWSGFISNYFPGIILPSKLNKLESRLIKCLPYFILGDWGFFCKKKSY